MRTTFTLILLLLPLLGVFADVPVRTEQVIYSIVAYNGRDYSPTFSPETSDTVYLISNAPSFVSVRKTFVYWWPPIGRWQADTNTLNEFQPGSLEVKNARGSAIRITLQRYTFFNVSGRYEQNWRFAVGDDAEREYQHSREISDAYMQASAAHQKEHARYLAELRELSTLIETRKAQGRDYAEIKEKMDSLPAPTAPRPPSEYAVPPSPVQQAFIIELPPGRYRARLLDADGAALEGSDKTLVVHTHRRKDSVGYEVIPADKWTRPVESKIPRSMLSVNGKADLYLAAFHESEYNELYYGKTIDNEARGNPNVYAWTRIEQVPEATLSLLGVPRESALQREQPFIIEKGQGASLGYTISPFDPLGAHQGREPDLFAFHVPVRAGGRTIEVGAMDSESRPLAGSEREIRIVQPVKNWLLLALIILAPLAVMSAVLSARARLYRGRRERSGASPQR
jgi:hypothetical protein